MKPENRAKLEKYRHVYNILIKDQTLSLDHVSRSEIIQFIKDEIDSKYTVNEYCGHCVADMVKLAFRHLDSQKVEKVKVKFK